MKVVTNHRPRRILNSWDLTSVEREQFDYYDWPTNAEDESSFSVDKPWPDATFFRYKGEVYDLGEFTSDWGITKGAGLPEHLGNWHGYLSESAFSALVVRYTDDFEEIVVGRVIS